ADENRLTRTSEAERRIVDVDADHRGRRSEVVRPHVERAALGYADLEQPHAAIAERGEVLLVNREVVDPLVEQTSGAVRDEGGERGVLGQRDGLVAEVDREPVALVRQVAACTQLAQRVAEAAYLCDGTGRLILHDRS